MLPAGRKQPFQRARRPRPASVADHHPSTGSPSPRERYRGTTIANDRDSPSLTSPQATTSDSDGDSTDSESEVEEAPSGTQARSQTGNATQSTSAGTTAAEDDKVRVSSSYLLPRISLTPTAGAGQENAIGTANSYQAAIISAEHRVAAIRLSAAKDRERVTDAIRREGSKIGYGLVDFPPNGAWRMLPIRPGPFFFVFLLTPPAPGLPNVNDLYPRK